MDKKSEKAEGSEEISPESKLRGALSQRLISWEIAINDFRNSKIKNPETGAPYVDLKLSYRVDATKFIYMNPAAYVLERVVGGVRSVVQPKGGNIKKDTAS